MSLWHFHSNATLNETHYYGYGSAVYKEKTSNELGQLCEGTCRVRTCVIELLTVINSCVLKRKQLGRVLAGCVICELCSRTGRSCTCVRILEEL
jgi:hypothetical protein